MVFQKTVHRSTNRSGEMHDLTDDVLTVVRESGVRTGIVTTFVIGSTAAIGTIEFEPGLQEDLPATLQRLMPASKSYGHERAWHDGNGHSHLQATMLGPSVTVPVTNGKPRLGTWQQVFLIECDVKARQREVVLTVAGE